VAPGITIKDKCVIGARSSVLKDLMEKGSFSTTAILFATGSDKIQSESTTVLNQIKDALSQAPDMRIKIIGHTDNEGDDASNLALSKKRANAVKMKLSTMGISSNRMETDGKGESDPVAENNSAFGKAQNRRVEFVKIN
jgi:outer membrane protein OmpA-like peptidoglycan-associated protein